MNPKRNNPLQDFTRKGMRCAVWISSRDGNALLAGDGLLACPWTIPSGARIMCPPTWLRNNVIPSGGRGCTPREDKSDTFPTGQPDSMRQKCIEHLLRISHHNKKCKWDAVISSAQWWYRSSFEHSTSLRELETDMRGFHAHISWFTIL